MQVLEEAIRSAQAGIQEGRAAIRDLRSEPLQSGNLPELLKATCSELADAHELHAPAPRFILIVEGTERTLSPAVLEEVSKVARELIRNAFQHAAASRIEVEIRFDAGQLRLLIRDDGKGIDPKILEASGRPGHWGIPGMRERAQTIGARLEFWSEVGGGTEAGLTVPAELAYEKGRNGRWLWLLRGMRGE
jgi:signal transduction histidine kinase